MAFDKTAPRDTLVKKNEFVGALRASYTRDK